MKVKRLALVVLASFVVVAALSIGAESLFAHHGRGKTYDRSTTATLEGTVSAVLWRNPHIAVLIDVPDADGKVVTWRIEHSNVTTLARQGYNRNSLPVGEKVTAVIRPGAGGVTVGLMQYIVLEDGTQMFSRNGLGPLD